MLKKVFVSLLLALIVAFSLTSCKNDDDTVDGSSDFESEDDSSVGHVFHVNIVHPEAVRCNDDAADFFRNILS